ncbi:MAG: hypothetical protein KGY68_04665 [Candidatus Thermoplasmatota archaeon]|nr:hypothetical protein [Candidatus Thermoplasmatota archaeon]
MAAYTTLLVILVIVILVGIYFYFRHRARKKALTRKYGHDPSHTELYFEEYFEDIIESWDLVREDEAHRWADNMEDRLSELSSKIESLKSNKHKIDQEFEMVENRIDKLETQEEMR